jgi:hypothetical protein
VPPRVALVAGDEGFQREDRRVEPALDGPFDRERVLARRPGVAEQVEDADQPIDGVHLDEPHAAEPLTSQVTVQPDVEIGQRLGDMPLDGLRRAGRGGASRLLQPGRGVVPLPHDPSGRVSGVLELGHCEDRVLGVQAVLEQHLAAVHGVRELERDRAERLEPVDVSQVPGLGAVVDDDEEVEIRVVVEPGRVRSDGPDADQRDRVATIRQDPAELVEPGEQPAWDVRGHQRSRQFGSGLRSTVLAQDAISARREAPSLARMCSTWLLAVFGAMPSESAISAFV